MFFESPPNKSVISIIFGGFLHGFSLISAWQRKPKSESVGFRVVKICSHAKKRTILAVNRG